MPVTWRAGFAVEVQFDVTVGKHHRKLSAAGVEIEPTRLAVVNEPRHALLASVAVTRLLSRRPAEELERARGVEGVDHGGRRDRAVGVEVEVAGGAAALVGGPDPHLLASVAFERRLRVLELEGVVGVAEVGDFAVFHFFLFPFFFLFFFQRERRNKTRVVNL